MSKKAAFPAFKVQHRDKVCFPGGDSVTITGRGVMDNGSLMVTDMQDGDAGYTEYMAGIEEEVFLTGKDAQVYDRDPEAFEKKHPGYGIIEWSS